MPRPIWTGSIAFGLVNIPVKLFSAVSHQEVRFHMLHDKDGGRIRQKRVCALDGEEVAYENVVKGYEVADGEVVMIKPEELEALDPKATRTIEIEDFVDLAEIDPIYYQNSYHLAADRAGKAYNLLVAAMEKTQKVGIARMVMRTKQYLCAVRPKEGALLLSTMLYADEVVARDEVEPERDSEHPGAKELSMAEQLIASLSGEFKPEKYKDEYRERVLEMLKKKAEGERFEVRAEQEPAKVISLMEALKRSLGEAGASEDDEEGENGGSESESSESESKRGGKKAATKGSGTPPRGPKNKGPAKKRRHAG